MTAYTVQERSCAKLAHKHFIISAKTAFVHGGLSRTRPALIDPSRQQDPPDLFSFVSAPCFVHGGLSRTRPALIDPFRQQDPPDFS